MTSLMLASRLTRNLKIKGATNLTAHDASILLDAMNSGVQEWFSLAPLDRKQTADTVLIRPPVPVTIDILDGAKGFVYSAPTAQFPMGGYENEDSLIGKSIVLGGDPKINRLNRHGQLLLPYLGSGGAVAGLVYCDALQFSQNDATIIGNPKWVAENGASQELCERDNYGWWDSRWHCTPEIGSPEYFTTSIHNPLDCDKVYWLMRLWPLPSVRGIISIMIEGRPPALVFDDLQVARRIPIPEAEIADAIYLCEEHLIGTELWAEKADTSTVVSQAANTRTKLAGMSRHRSTGSNKIRTKNGW